MKMAFSFHSCGHVRACQLAACTKDGPASACPLDERSKAFPMHPKAMQPTAANIHAGKAKEEIEQRQGLCQLSFR